MDNLDWNRVNKIPFDSAVSQFIDLAMESALDGVVCDNDSAAMIKYRFPKCITMMPGFRLDSDEGDQKGTVTPHTLDKKKVDYLVVGHAVTNASQIKQMSEMLEHIQLLLRS